MKIVLAADHRGYKLKEALKIYLQENGYEIEDVGTNDFERVDFPVYAYKLSDKITTNEADYGIAVCGTGIGMSIALNKIKGIYCARVVNSKEAKIVKEHNNANVIALSGEIWSFKAKRMVKKFLKSEFITSDESYQRRINQIKRQEK